MGPVSVAVLSGATSEVCPPPPPQEYGLSKSVGPVSVAVLSGATSEDISAALSMRGSSASRAAEDEVGILEGGGV